MDRLQKVIAAAGLCSRREAEQWIRRGRVQINGRTASLGETADPEQDLLLVDGRPLHPRRAACDYLLLHKPAGYVTTVSDPRAAKTVLQLVSDIPQRVYPVGRLDKETTGLLLLTNDGELAHRLSHPRYGVEKVYRAKVAGRLMAPEIDTLRRGVSLEEGRTAPAGVRILSAAVQASVLEMTLHEGRKRQVRRMLEAVGHPVLALQRIRYGPLLLGSLREGSWRRLRSEELAALRKAAGLEGEPGIDGRTGMEGEPRRSVRK